MKKFLILLLVLFMCLAGCSTSNSEDKEYQSSSSTSQQSSVSNGKDLNESINEQLATGLIQDTLKDFDKASIPPTTTVDKSLVYELNLYHCMEKYLEYFSDVRIIMIDNIANDEDRSLRQSLYTISKERLQKEYTNIEYIFKNIDLKHREEATELFYSLKTCHDSIMGKLDLISNLNTSATTLNIVKNSLSDLTISLVKYQRLAESLYDKTFELIG